VLLTKIQESASKNPDQLAIQLKEGESYRKHTYRELIRAVASVARALSQQGIGKGDRVALLSENRPEWVFSYLAVTSLGAVIVPLDAQLTEKEVAVLLSDSGAKAVCVSAATRQKLPKNGAVTIISFDAGDGVLFSEMMKAHPEAPLPPAPSRRTSRRPAPRARPRLRRPRRRRDGRKRQRQRRASITAMHDSLPPASVPAGRLHR